MSWNASLARCKLWHPHVVAPFLIRGGMTLELSQYVPERGRRAPFTALCNALAGASALALSACGSTSNNADLDRGQAKKPSELPSPYMLTLAEESELAAHVTGEDCPRDSPVGSEACTADFGSAIHSSGAHDLYRNMAGVWRFCSDNVAEITRTGPASPRAFEPHAGIEFSPEGWFYFLDEDSTGSLVRRQGLDHEARVMKSLNDDDSYVKLAFENGDALQLRVVRSACPELMRLILVTAYSPEVEYSRESQ